MNMNRMTMTWSGFSGAPGYTNLHFSAALTPTSTELSQTATKVHDFFYAWRSFLPNAVTINFPSELEEFSTTTGELVGTHGFTAPAAVVGTGGSAVFSSAVGACVNWKTNTVVNGRKLRGRTFMVPLQSLPSFDADGSLNPSARLTMLTACTNLMNDATGLPLFIWHRPSPGGSDGAAGSVTATTINDKTAVLRSRRD